jgi:hypothetical protein
VTETAARLLLLTYNLWTLFVRLMGAEPGQHVEAVRSRRQFLVLAAQLVRTGRQKVWKLAVSRAWWETLTAALCLADSKCAAVGKTTELSATVSLPNTRGPARMVRPVGSTDSLVKLNCGF